MTRQAGFMTRSVTITANEQADRISNLLALREMKVGKPLRFAEISEFMEQRRTPLSKSTWHAMRDPSYRIVKMDLLCGIADFFEVDPDFMLLEEAEPTEEYRQNLREMTARRVDETATVFYRHSQKLGDEDVSSAIDSFLKMLPRKQQEDVINTITRGLGAQARTA